MDAPILAGLRMDGAPEADSYLSKLPAVQFLCREKQLTFDAPVTFFVGENGTGKSTVLEAIAVAAGFNPEGGTRNFQFSTRDTHAGLHRLITLKRRRQVLEGYFLRAESFYNAASYLSELYEHEFRIGAPTPYGSCGLHEQSHGESFLALVEHRFVPGGLYLLDEPEAALSPARQLTLMACIDRLARAGSQFLIATHSPILMALPGSRVELFDETGIRPVHYTETEHYRLTRRFLEDPQRMLHYLLEEDND